MMWKLVLPVLAVVLLSGYGSGSTMVGGFQDIDANDEGARNALNFAVVQHNRGSNDLYLSQVAEVIKVQRQVVAGFNYRITVRLAKTPCRKGGAMELCEIHQDIASAQPYQCTFTVWSRPWLNDISVKEKC